MTSRIPHLLEPHLSLPPESSLITLTSVLGASTNWLVLRHLHALLKPAPSPHNQQQQHQAHQNSHQAAGDEGEVAVLLVSFLRDLPFWRENLSRLGIDLDAAGRRGRFGFVDGLSGGGGGGGLFSVPGVGGLGGQQQQRKVRQGWEGVLGNAAPGEIGRVVLEGVERLRRSSSTTSSAAAERRVVLVIDGLDFVLAALDPSLGLGQSLQGGGDAPGTAIATKEMLMELREKTHAVIITLAADDPLIKEQETTLEKQHAWFALSLAHEADMVTSLRLLDTGTAKDVSGVIRITHREARVKDHEYLYHVGGDGGVRVFERGQ
ncbi:hypothetical protein F5144DRAFT_631781 [Chaetomium tenue]|uniref:Uncharacterized protein n=1 Tax=Chaetomium tenue TaxID=1854479 RepID=A0ACB7P4L2_9PEZI|nr:hypothetical protein F5144DRAFT_631781 [Chaetomium globosum]